MRTIHLKYLLLALLFANQATAQEPIFDDAFLSDYEIVLLGEQTHGDGSVFEKKLEMVKELHEKGGYNLLVFESGMYDNLKANQLYADKKEDASIFKQSVGWLYSDTKVFQELLEYMETHPKLKIMGFDSQESSLFETYFLDDLKTLCQKNNISISEETFRTVEKTLIVRDIESYVGNKKDSTALYSNIISLQNKLDKIPKKDVETKMLVQTFKSVFSDMDYMLKDLQKEKIYVQNPRDKQMAENLIFLKETYPKEKIMGWGASYHFTNRLSDFEFTPTTENYITKVFQSIDSLTEHKHTALQEEIDQIKELRLAVPMGQILKQKYGDKLFSLAFTSYEGTYRNFMHDNVLPILAPPENSFEKTLKKENIKEKLVVLEDSEAKFYTSVLGYIPLYAHWNTIFDGIYYIKKMAPPVFIEYGSERELISVANTSNTINGRITDADTSAEIPYTDVYYTDTNKSTVTDAAGNFSISRSNNSGSYLVFSAIGYESDSIQVRELKNDQTIRLKVSTDNIVLNEAVVTAKSRPLSAEEIIKRARKNVANNYVQTPYNQRFLFKVVDYSTRDTIAHGEEALIETYNKNGINGSNKAENGFFGEIQHIRNNSGKYDENLYKGIGASWNGIGGLWVLFNRDIILSKANVLYRTPSYDTSIEGVVNYERSKVYKISFVNNSPGSYSTGFGYPAPEKSNGAIYIDTENYAVLKYEHYIVRQPYVSKKSKNIIKSNLHITQSYKQVDGKYFINLLEMSNISNAYSTDDVVLDKYFKLESLVSNNIETENVSIIKRPLIDLKKGFKKDADDSFWDSRPMDFRIIASSFDGKKE
ncbi:erythromycin esterase family protein [Maribacter sp. R77961]|uniref:erythromycin esterase family protein n=1 Tax=Maribacter sp. R77961 TaxID=3093871 RepID=UPI0037C96C51